MTKENIKKLIADPRLIESARKAKCSASEFFRRICVNGGIKNVNKSLKFFS